MTELTPPSHEMWANLRCECPDAADGHATLDVLAGGNPTGILMAMSEDGRLHLLIPLPSIAGDEAQVNIKFRGLYAQENMLAIRGEKQLYLDASAAPSFEAMFTVVARELAHAVAIKKQNPRTAVESTVARWASF